MNTAEKVARLEAYLHRLQENAKKPRPKRRAAIQYTDVAGTIPIDATSLAADAARAAAEVEAQRANAARNAARSDEPLDTAELAVARAFLDETPRERAAKEAADKAAKEKAAKDAADKAAKEAADKAAKEKAAKEAADKAAKEKAAKEAADKAAKDKAAKEAADKAAKEAADKAAKEKAAKDAADKAAKEKAAKDAADKAAKEKAAKDAADKAAKEKAAKDAADKAAKEKAAKDAADKAAKEKAAKDAADKAAKEKAAKDAAEKTSKEAADKKAPSTIDELFAELETGGADETQAAPIIRVPPEAPAPAAPGKGAPPPMPLSLIKDETTLDQGELPTVIGSSISVVGDGELPTQIAASPIEAPTRVADTYASLLGEHPTIDAAIVVGEKRPADRSPEPDEPTVIRRPTAKDQKIMRGEAALDDELPTIVTPSGEAASDIKVSPIVAEPAEDTLKPAASNEPKISLAEPLREAAERSAREAKERAEREAALRPKAEPAIRDKEADASREEVTTASQRLGKGQAEPAPVVPLPQAVEGTQEPTDTEKKKKSSGSMVGLLIATALLVGGGVYLGLRNGWFEANGPPSSGTTNAVVPSGRPTVESPRTAPNMPTIAPTATQATTPSATPTAEPSGSASAAPTSSASAAPSGEASAAPGGSAASATPGVPVVEKTDESQKLKNKAFLTVLSTDDSSVYLTGRKLGPANKRYEVNCTIALIRLGAELPGGAIDWRSAPGLSISIPCQSSVTLAITPGKGPWPTPGGGGGAPHPGGGDPY